MKKIYALFITTMLFLSACNADLLDIDNPNEATTETFWKTEADAQAGINACYSALYKEGTWMRWLSFRYDLTSDEGLSTSPWIELANWTHFNYTNYNFYEGNNIHWEHFYMAIYRTNQVLKFVPEIDFDATKKEQILAQAHFMRALWYFQINLLWEKAPIITEPTDAGYVPVESSEEQIWEQIESDLTTAANVLPESWDAANLGRATKGAAKALLAKAYMQQHKYTQAKTELEWLISKEGSLYGLIDNWVNNFTHLDENNIEGVFEIQFDDTNKGGTGNNASMATGFQRTQFYAPNGIGWADGKARRWVVDEFLKEKRADGKNDTRLYYSVLYRDYLKDFPDGDEMYYSVNTNTGWDEKGWGNDCYIRKYGTSYYRDREDYFAPNNYRIIRYADVLLSYAECIIETGGTTAQAAEYVDKIRVRAGLNKLSESTYASSLSSKDAFLKRLQMERALELCFEGWRWADLKRWGLLDSEAGLNELRSRDEDFNNFVLGKHNRLPIPQIEIDNSEGGLTQNPKY
ncbi:MAG: RagB/SusD family nutrient uptake outer membrane protein [Tannerella sp.]|jgi:hypothetical protein|nr:RagB/SusD family nutrient uptake outer membrane protein [Tannerella sp.]